MQRLTSVYLDYEDYPSSLPNTGDLIFCARVTEQGCGPRINASHRPYRTNQSGEVRITGWCGSTNNVDIEALGAYRVKMCTAVDSRTGVRLTLQSIPDEEALAIYAPTYAEVPE